MQTKMQLFEPGSPQYAAATKPENSTAVQCPAFVARPTTAEDVAAVVREAAERGLSVVPQATGHGAAGSIGGDTILIDTSALTELKIDKKRRVATAGAGLTWGAINAEAEKHGLLGLAGSSPSVAIAGFTFAGGYGWLTRPHGAASSALLEVEYVDGDGTIRVASESAEDEVDRDALWAFRGGGGVGIATKLEFELVPVPDLYAGYMLWQISALAEVVAAWASGLDGVGPSVATSISVLHTPPAPPFPPEMQGVPVVHLAIASSAGADEARALIDALAAATEPTVNTWGPADAEKLGSIHLDPPTATPALGIARWLGGDAPELVRSILATAAGTESPLALVEVRAFANDAAPREGAATSVGGPFALHAIGALVDPSKREAIEDAFAKVMKAAEPVDTGRSIGSWVEGAVSVPDALAAGVREQVQEIANHVDPDGRIERSRFVR